MSKRLIKIVSILLVVLLTACGSSNQVMADDRRFLDLSLEFLGEYQLSQSSLENTPIGGLSGITYDQKRDQFYAISDDRSLISPSRFYTLKLQLKPSQTGDITLDKVTVEGVTFLKNAEGNTYSPYQLDPEGIAMSPRDTLFISTDGDTSKKMNPLVAEFNRETGQFIQNIRIPERFLVNKPDSPQKGVRNNLGFEALDISATSLLKDDPFRLFVATEFSLSQDILVDSEGKSPIRWLHYVISPIGDPVLIAEHLYLLEPAPTATLSNGLTDLVALPKEGYWLSLERTFGLLGNGAKIFQVVTGDASDTSRTLAFKEGLQGIKPLNKKLVFDLSTLNLYFDNLEGMTLGPRLPDGSQSLVLVSDDNFNQEQVTQFLLFRISM